MLPHLGFIIRRGPGASGKKKKKTADQAGQSQVGVERTDEGCWRKELVEKERPGHSAISHEGTLTGPKKEAFNGKRKTTAAGRNVLKREKNVKQMAWQGGEIGLPRE